MHPGRARERLDRDFVPGETIADFTEDLPGAGVVVAGGTIKEAREDNGAVAVDAVERIGRATAQVDGADTGAGVTGNVRGNVVGSVASVTARVTANSDQLAGQTITAAAGVTFPTSVASPTNITAGTITTVTNLTNAPTNGDFTAAMKTSLNAATPSVTVSDKTGFSLTAAYDPAKTVYAVPGDAMALTSGERTTLAGVIWANASRTLTSFGTLVADIATAVWGAATRTLSTFGFTVTTDISSLVTTNLDATVSSRLATSGYTVPPTAAENADGLLKRDMSAVTGEAARSPLNALRFLRNKWSLVSTTLTVTKEDDTTTAWTGSVGSTVGADPVTSVDPT